MSIDRNETFDSESIAYRYKPSFYEVEEEEIDSVILTKDGDLVELCEAEELSRCILCPASTPYINLKTFYTYEPYFKYYLVHIRDQLYIIKKGNRNTLKLERTLESVSHFLVEDRNNVGEPQILVWSIGNKSPSVLNVFCNHMDEPDRIKIIPSTILKIKAQSKALESRISETQKVIFDKTMLASRMCMPNTFNHQEKLPPTCNTGNSLFKVLGEEKFNLKHSTNICPISYGKPWLRLLPDIVVVGLYVCNLQECEIRTVSLTGLDPAIQFSKTVIFRTTSGFDLSGEVADYKPTSFFAGLTHGYVIGITKEPIFIKKTLVIDLILTFTVGNIRRTEQIYIGDIHVPHENVILSTLLPFKDKKDVTDLLVLIATSSTSDIVYRLSEGSNLSLKSVLLDMCFVELGPHFLVHDFSKNSAFSGIALLVINEETYSSLRIYYRKIKQMYLFIISLKNKLGSHGLLEERFLNPATVVCSRLNEEINALHKYFGSSSIQSSSTAEGECCLAVDSQSLSEILGLETDTEKCFPLIQQFEDQ